MQMRNQRLLGLIAVALLSTMIISVSASQKSFAQSQVTLNGAGATFPFPLIDTWRVAYQKIHPDVNINYQSIDVPNKLNYRYVASFSSLKFCNSSVNRDR